LTSTESTVNFRFFPHLGRPLIRVSPLGHGKAFNGLLRIWVVGASVEEA